MGLPSKRRTKSSKLRRASHFALLHPNLGTCSNCGKPVRPHNVCKYCGMYGGKKILAVKSKAEKKLRKREKQQKKEKEEEPKK